MKKSAHSLIVLVVFFQCVFVLAVPSLVLAEGYELTRQIRSAIEDVSSRGNAQISARVNEAEVILSGVVENAAMKQKIAHEVEMLSVGREVTNLITVDPHFGRRTYADDEIRQAIDQALKPEGLQYSSLNVNSGIVTVSANLSSFREIDRMLAIIQGIPGVKDVNSDAKVNGQTYMSVVTKNY